MGNVQNSGTRAASLLLAAMFALVIAIYVVIAMNYPPTKGETFKTNPFEAAVAVVTSLFVVAVLLERSLAIINSLIWGEEQRGIELRLAAKKTLDPSGDDEVRLVEILTNEERLRLLLGFVAALFVSAGGIRALQGLVELGDRAQDPLFYTADVLLTAGLLAGGSNGLAFLMQFFKDHATRNPSDSKPMLRSRLTTTT